MKGNGAYVGKGEMKVEKRGDCGKREWGQKLDMLNVKELLPWDHYSN